MADIITTFKKNKILTNIVVSFAVSAAVGAVFGYWGATSLNQNLVTPFARLIRPTTTETPAISDEARVIAAVQKAVPAVVSIVATKDLTVVERQGIFNPFENFCKDQFFRQFLGSQCDVQSQPPQTKTERQQVAAGSGFIISPDGLILTNKHVINIAEADFTVITSGNKKYPAKILAKDPVQDLALLKIDVPGLKSLPLADSDKLQIGQTVIAIGNALGEFSNSVSKGVISGLSRSIVASEGGGRTERLEQVIQTDAAINPGNSGGPLLNLSGEVIGINTAIAQGAQNVGFAIPINQAKRDIQQVKTLGKISYPFLGVRYLTINDEIKEKNNLSVNYGALVVRGETQADLAVTPDSPADKAGIRENDIILEANSKRINQENDLAKVMQSFVVGQTVTFKILSGGQEKVAQIKLEERK
ncbi:MAG: trypsin-like peptidase domain-containing protein [Candidatus Yanofskybacteria bacterium]|nr:trypsin-like peptidase domain-containing protein [Candidatus Yanofskybacteria bacterium]